MAGRMRVIKPKFWDDQKITKLTLPARLCFIGLWNFADDNGIGNADITWLRSKIFPCDNISTQKFAGWMAELTNLGLINKFKYKGDFFYQLPNFAKHQIINRPNLDDLFIPNDIFEKAMLNSVINHGLITDASLPLNIGEERSVKEGRGGDARGAPNPKKVSAEILFKDSEFFEFEKFEKCFLGTDYEQFNLKIYYESVLNWSNSKNEKRVDWISTARTFMLKDTKKGDAILKTTNLLYQNGKHPTNNNGGNQSSRILAAMEAKRGNA